jgi:DNA-binding NarL/FixJ family response regulator
MNQARVRVGVPELSTFAPRVAFVDDDPDLLAGLRRALRPLKLGWDDAYYSDPLVAVAALRKAPVDVAVLDMRMPGMNGAVLAGILAAECPRTLSIVLSGSTDFDLAISSINVGRIFRYLLKPCPTTVLVGVVKDALRASSATASDTGLNGFAKVAIDHLSMGVIVLGARGQVLFTNQRAGNLLARGDDILVGSSGVCHASTAEDTRRLHKAVRAARDSKVPDALILNSHSHKPLRVIVRPGEIEDGAEAAVCLYLFTDDDRPNVDPQLLRSIFGLTTSESRLAAALAGGLSLEAAARAEGWTLNSARSYLKAVFSKVGVSRQADLVRVVLTSTGR